MRLDHLLSKDIFGTSSSEDAEECDILYSVLNVYLTFKKWAYSSAG